MPDPRSCPLCRTEYVPLRTGDPGHATLRAEHGGTPGPSSPDQPGRLLTLLCQACPGEHEWDF